jgi:hypothetical protein
MHRDDPIDKELRFHIDPRVDDLVASGITVDQARLELGGVIQTKEGIIALALQRFPH